MARLYVVTKEHGRWGIRTANGFFLTCESFAEAYCTAISAADLLANHFHPNENNQFEREKRSPNYSC
jgi:hypothetical protein